MGRSNLLYCTLQPPKLRYIFLLKVFSWVLCLYQNSKATSYSELDRV